jgi:hypothetical protein
VYIIHFIVSRKFHEFALPKFNASLFALTHSMLGRGTTYYCYSESGCMWGDVWSLYQPRIQVQVPNVKDEGVDCLCIGDKAGYQV